MVPKIANVEPNPGVSYRLATTKCIITTRNSTNITLKCNVVPRGRVTKANLSFGKAAKSACPNLMPPRSCKSAMLCNCNWNGASIPINPSG
ncbi:uncharacterized protein PgNI_00796 [Pyricularia grisea]|uniref:Uncharacterized protein n=1 Tax=Pyricularia grisea TaxID=148305 RepID=A0A6P8BI20_PYRGI|nr:uncharacterized protein PgNI_00796 [Pyricularia grisea]TLD16269.1 hypothetical protein PgNI_00796 [Pyricularia grisea]